jgi:hypothetical protein
MRARSAPAFAASLLLWLWLSPGGAFAEAYHSFFRGRLPSLERVTFSEAAPAARAAHVSFRADEHWIDAVLGLRLGIDLGECLALRVRADVGGFGIGDASQLAYSAEAALVVALARHWEAELPFTILGVDRDRGDLALDTVQYGPRLGLAYRF